MKFISLNKLVEESVSHNPEIRKKVMLRAGELPHLTNFSQASFAPGQAASAHAHKDLTGAWKPSLFIAGRKGDTGQEDCP